MKKTLLLSAAVLLFAAPAFAADMASKYPVKAVAAPVPAFSWTGFYLGGNVGYAWGSGDLDVSNIGASVPAPDPEGWFGGAQVGYNFQFDNNVVLGVEADVDFGSIDDDTVGTDGDTPSDPAYASAKIDYFGTVRARVGYAFDRFLPYVTGGVAWGHTKLDASYFGPGDVTITESGDSTTWGWTVGGGVEYAITDHWTVKAEYLYVDLGDDDYTVAGVPVEFGSNFSSAKLGVNYKF